MTYSNHQIDPCKILTSSEITALLAECQRRSERSVNSHMNLVLFRCSSCVGLRVSEISELQLRDIVLTDVRSLQNDRRPTARTEVSLDSRSVLGILFEQTYDAAAVQIYHLEQQTLLSRMSVILSLRELQRLGLIETETDVDFGQEFQIYRVSKEGSNWVENHRHEVEEAMKEIAKRTEAAQPKRSNTSEDAPF